MGRGCEIHAADLRGEGEPARLASLAKERFGRLDILINNAGANRRGDFFTLTDADWDAGFDSEVLRAKCSSAAAGWLHLKQAGGSIVFNSGIGARTPAADYMIGATVIGAQPRLHEGAGGNRQEGRRAGQHRQSRLGGHRAFPATPCDHHEEDRPPRGSRRSSTIAGSSTSRASARRRTWLPNWSASSCRRGSLDLRLGHRHRRRPGRSAADVEVRLNQKGRLKERPSDPCWPQCQFERARSASSIAAS